MSTRKLIALFFMVLFATAALLLLVVKMIHWITKDHSRTYGWSIAIFSFLTAAMVVYANIGR